MSALEVLVGLAVGAVALIVIVVFTDALAGALAVIA